MGLRKKVTIRVMPPEDRILVLSNLLEICRFSVLINVFTGELAHTLRDFRLMEI